MNKSLIRCDHCYMRFEKENRRIKPFRKNYCSIVCRNRGTANSKDFDWQEIQKLYNEGRSVRELAKEYKVSGNRIRANIKVRTLSEAAKVGKQRKPYKHPEEVKKRLSAIKTKFYQESPEKIPYRLYHSSKESYPEKLFRQALDREGIESWIQKYAYGIYEFDFAFPGLKLDIEIDGATHLKEKVIQKDLKRDAIVKKDGWTVLRFTAKEVKNNINGCLEILKSYF